MRKSALLIAAALFASQALAIEEEAPRDGKALPVFQVVKFPNDVCDGGARNGTCYTAEECSSKGGTSSGSCASGYGVCCVFSLGCGATATENSTYLVQASATTIASPCSYKVCKCSSNICRIRFDLTSFIIAQPITGTTITTAAAAVNVGGGIGDCLTDTFSVNAPGSIGSPVICGTNSGYHMIVDASDTCHDATFTLGDTTTSRQWDIKVTQYACGDEDLSGWSGCLQYYTATAGHIQSYNFPATTTVGATATHLSNQHYDICIRRASGFCAICYTQAINSATIALPAAQTSFGVGISSNGGAAKSEAGTNCNSDYLAIPFGDVAAKAATGAIAETSASFINRFCGRYLATDNAADGVADGTTICTKRTPFTVGVHFDSNEASTANNMANTNEAFGAPGGIVGFKLTYFQTAC